jgi:nucleoside-diphosphate-sugar epimerase
VPRLAYASSMSILGYPFFERLVVRPTAVRFRASACPAGRLCAEWVGEIVAAAAPPDLCRGEPPHAVDPDARDLPAGGRAANAPPQACDQGIHRARDAAAAFVAAAERPVTGHLRLFISAADTFMDAATETLVRAAYPGVRMNRALPGHETVFDLAEAHGLLGWSPRHSWRDY